MRRIIQTLLNLSATILVFLLITTVAYAAPAFEEYYTFKQPSGETFTAVSRGDERFNYTVTDSGEVVILSADGYWYYAVPDDVKGMEESDRRYITDEKPDNALMKEDMPEIREEQIGSQKDNSASLSAANPSMSVSIPDATGAQKTLVLLVSFSNLSIQYTENEWSDEFFGVSGKTVYTYYQEVSGNKSMIVPASESYGTDSDGIVKVTLPYAHPNTCNTVDSRNQALVKDALVSADAYVNFADYDSNHDGYISTSELHVVTVIAGYERSYSYAVPSVWAHHASIGGTVTPPILDGVSLCDGAYSGGYIQVGERHDGHMATIGTVCHELGHDFGLPDLYDTVDSNGISEGVGYYSLMGSGNWGYCSGTVESPGTTPTHLDAWSKTQLGFVTPTVAIDPGSYKVISIANDYNVIKIDTADPDEYFLVEYRGNDGFDKGLTCYSGYSGIAIWHIDESVIEENYRSNTVNGDETHKGVDLEEANYAVYGGSQLDDNNSMSLMYQNLFWINELFGPDTSPNSNLYSGADTGIRIVIAPPGLSDGVMIHVGPITSIGAIAGTPVVGKTLTAGAVSFTDATVTYEWQCADTLTGTYTNITGATGNQYAPTDADLGKYIRVVATGTGLYIGTVTSDAIGPVRMTISNTDFISGAARVGQTLTAGTVTPADATVAYQWMRAGPNHVFSDISGAKGSTYTLKIDDAAMYIRVRVTGTGNYIGEVMSSYIGPVVSYQLISVSIVGEPLPDKRFSVGVLMTYSGSVSSAAAKLQWMSSESESGTYTDIPGATQNDYLLSGSDALKYFKVRATGTGDYVGTVTSNALGPVKAKITGIGETSGTPQPGQTLTAGAVTPEGATVTYQWMRAGVNLIYEDIPGATSGTYTLTEEDANKYIAVKATGTGLYVGEAISTDVFVYTETIALTGITSITGMAMVGGTLTAGNVSPVPSSFTLQWIRSGSLNGEYSNIEGATGLNYVVTEEDFGKYIKVTVTGAGRYVGTITSGCVFIHFYLITEIGAINGTAEAGATLTAGALSPTGATCSYQWMRCDTSTGTYTNIEGATESTYALTGADIGKYVKVTATGTGTYAGDVTSSAIGPVGVITAIGYIDGLNVIGSTLTAGTVTPVNATVTYQWQRADTLFSSFSNIEGAAEKAYVLTDDDFGMYIRVVATGTGSYTGTLTSYMFGPIKKSVEGISAIIGTVQSGLTLTAGTVSPSEATVSYQWMRADTADGTYLNISGATGNTYKLTREDSGNYIKVRCIGKDLFANTATSAAVGPVTYGDGALSAIGSGLEYNSVYGTLSFTLEAFNNTGSDLTVDFIIAVYGSSGRLLDTQIVSGVTVSSLSWYSNTVTLSCGTISEAATVKIFVLDSNLGYTPVAAPWSGTTQ